MKPRPQLPSALTVAGSDSGGGAGVQADLKTFAAHGLHGICAITCLTAQNPDHVLGVQPSSSKFLEKQLEAVAPFNPGAMKTGMLYSRALIIVVTAFVRDHPRIPLVIDPVMIATSGSTLLKPSAVSALKKLLPLATIMTPNIPEAEALSRETISDIEDQRRVARILSKRFNTAVLLKGGHMTGHREAADVYNDGSEELLLASPWIRTGSAHGTGCTLSAAIASNLALKHSLPVAVARAKEFITGAIARGSKAGKFQVLDPFWKKRA